ncbi:hypothetical protein OROGR_019470 [Orobanche gracilis]
MLEAFKSMETCFEEKDLGLACLKIGLKLDQEVENSQKAHSFAQRALRILDGNNDSSDGDSEALAHLRKALEIQERTLEEYSKELGKANRDMAEAYVAVLNL